MAVAQLAGLIQSRPRHLTVPQQSAFGGKAYITHDGSADKNGPPSPPLGVANALRLVSTNRLLLSERPRGA